MRYKTVYLSLLLFISILLTGCAQGDKINQINKESIIYGSGLNAEQNLTIADPATLKTIKTIKVTNGWTDKIYMDNKRNIWMPVVYKPDMTNHQNKVFILNNNGKIDKITVGFSPHYIFFKGNRTYVVCDEDGANPTIYQIKSNLQTKKLMTVKNGGLISNAVFDGQNIYFSCWRNTGNFQFYPTLVKINLNGKVNFQQLSNQQLGLNNLLLMDHKLILGLEAPENHSTLVMYDTETLHKIKNLNYTESVVGDIIPVNNGNIAVTNYSKTQSSGKKISILNVKENKVIKTFESKYPTEVLSYINGQFISVNNYHCKLEVLDENGKSKIIRKAPLQVSNMILRPQK